MAGVAYINDDPGWTYGGFVFDQAMSGGRYKVEFDFNFSNYSHNYGVVYLTDEAHGGGDQNKEFRLINLNEGAMSVGSKDVNHSGKYRICKRQMVSLFYANR